MSASYPCAASTRRSASVSTVARKKTGRRAAAKKAAETHPPSSLRGVDRQRVDETSRGVHSQGK